MQTLVQRAHLYNINLAPTAAFKINDHLSIGSAMNIYYGQLKEYRSVVLGPPPTPYGNFHFRGQDWASAQRPASSGRSMTTTLLPPSTVRDST